MSCVPSTNLLLRVIVGDTFNHQIASYKLDGTAKQVLAEGDMESVDGLAVDWISGNVFWTNGGETSGIFIFSSLSFPFKLF